jgi:hypothetical protein
MKRAIVFGLALIVAAVALSDATANAREKGGRRGRKGGGESYSSYSHYSEPTTRIVYQVPPYWMMNPNMYPPNGYPTNTGYPTNPPMTYPTNPVVPTTYPTVPTTYSTNVPTTTTVTPATPEIAALIEALKAAGYVK